jgi:glutamate racemase
MSNYPLGIFDSGFGGLSVMRALKKILPKEDILYLADTLHLPYGNKSREEIIRFSLDNAAFLADKGAKLLIVACHTATAWALDTLQKSFDLPIIGLFVPTLLELQAHKEIQTLAILGTESMISSQVYQSSISMHFPHVKIISIPCPLLAPLIEKGLFNGRKIEMAIKDHLNPILNQSIDALLLCCSHYSFLKTQFQSFLKNETLIIDPSEKCAEFVKQFLIRKKLNREKGKGTHRFYVSSNLTHFQQMAPLFLGSSIEPNCVALK